MLECADQVGEKESGVRQVMSTMGLLTSPFWLTWALFEGQLISTLLTFVLHAKSGEHLASCRQPFTHKRRVVQKALVNN